MSANQITSSERKRNEEGGIRARDCRRGAGGSGPAALATTDRSAKEQRVSFDLVLRELRAHNFAVLATVDEDGAADSAGVNYGPCSISTPS